MTQIYTRKQILKSLKKQKDKRIPYKQLDLYGGVVYEMAYKKQEGGFWTPEKDGDELEGKVIEVIEGNFGKQYIIETEKDGLMTTPSHALIQVGLRKAKVDDKVKIVFKGTEPPKVKGHSPTNLYDVFIDE